MTKEATKTINVLWILNHKIKDDQIQGLKDQFCEEGDTLNLIEMPEETAKLLANIDPTIESVSEIADTIVKTMPKGVGDNYVAIVQGEACVQTLIVQIYQRCNIPCFAATSARRSVDEIQPNGSTIKKSVFDHVRFRRYPDISGRN